MSKSKLAAFILIAIAVVGWLAVILLPFSDLSLGSKAVAVGVSLGVAEGSFLIAMILLGRAYGTRVLNRLRKPPTD